MDYPFTVSKCMWTPTYLSTCTVVGFSFYFHPTVQGKVHHLYPPFVLNRSKCISVPGPRMHNIWYAWKFWIWTLKQICAQTENISYNRFKAVKSAGRIPTSTLQFSRLNLPLLWLLAKISLLINGAVNSERAQSWRKMGCMKINWCMLRLI